MRQWLSRILTSLLVVPGLGMASIDQAAAGQCRLERTLVQVGDGAVDYKTAKRDCVAGVTPQSGAPAGSKSSGKASPPCDVQSADPATFCLGSSPCYIKDVVTPYDPPAAKPPTPGADWHVRMCLVQLLPGRFDWRGTAEWVGQAPQPPSLVDQAREASGQVVLPRARLEFSPPRRTLVNLDTWYWAQGLTGAELRGTSAFGLVAIATPGRLEVTPGDGSASFTCAWVTGKSDRCWYAYRRSSVGGPRIGANGGPAYEATGRATWTLRFEDDGAPVRIAGAPTEISGPGMTSAVEVAEVQTLVTGVG